jgi:hypothetical protein
MRFLGALILFILLNSCIQKQPDQRFPNLDMVNAEYQNIKENFNKELVSHFPAKIDTNYLYDRWSLDSADQFSLELGIKVNESDLLNMVEILNKVKLTSYSVSDSCLFILNRFATKENYGVVKLSEINQELISLDCYADRYPVPNFWTSIFYTNSTTSHLPEDFELFILDSKPGIISDKYTAGVFMPENWTNGFSKGVAISEQRNVVIYWLIVW